MTAQRCLDRFIHFCLKCYIRSKNATLNYAGKASVDATIEYNGIHYGYCWEIEIKGDWTTPWDGRSPWRVISLRIIFFRCNGGQTVHTYYTCPFRWVRWDIPNSHEDLSPNERPFPPDDAVSNWEMRWSQRSQRRNWIQCIVMAYKRLTSVGW